MDCALHSLKHLDRVIRSKAAAAGVHSLGNVVSIPEGQRPRDIDHSRPLNCQWKKADWRGDRSCIDTQPCMSAHLLHDLGGLKHPEMSRLVETAADTVGQASKNSDCRVPSRDVVTVCAERSFGPEICGLCWSDL